MAYKVGLLLALPPSHGSASTTLGLAQAALKSGNEVYVYLIDEGVKNLHSSSYQALAHSGAKVFACAYGCQRHKVSTDIGGPRISLCGLVVLSGIIDACDSFLSFT